MTDRDEPPDPVSAAPAEDRKARLAAALKANIARRKAQARSRRAAADTGDGQAAET